MSATSQRDISQTAAQNGDWERALKIAHKVSQPWFQSQAYSEAARHAPDDKVTRIVKQAVDAARSDPDPYRQVAACAWAVNALLERGKIREASALVSELVWAADNISHDGNRFVALELVWGYSCQLPVSSQRVLLSAICKACETAKTWRVGRFLREHITEIAAYNPQRAQHLIDIMPNGNYKSQAQRRLTEFLTTGEISA